jgi:hypothetical protein
MRMSERILAPVLSFRPPLRLHESGFLVFDFTRSGSWRTVSDASMDGIFGVLQLTYFDLSSKFASMGILINIGRLDLQSMAFGAFDC